MKLTIIFILIGTLNLAANGYSQNARLNLSLQDVSLLELFSEIEDQSDFSFFYRDDQLDKSLSVSIVVNNSLISDVLDKVLKSSVNTYSVVDKIIVIRPKEGYRKMEVTGLVTTSSGETLPGVSILVKGKPQLGTITGADGKYSITVPDENSTLVFSFIGYKTQELSINGRAVINVTMVESTQSLEQVVVVGYGTVRKVDLIGSVTTIDEKDFNLGGSVNSIEQLIQGRVSGVQVSTVSAEPGGKISIRIRGNNSVTNSNEPLYVVDGFPMEDISYSFNPKDIASMQVLKDASATAIYGSRGANGVIIITTKRGKAGQSNLDVSVDNGWQSVKPDAYSMLTASQWLNQKNILAGFNSNPLPYTQEEIDNAGVGTNWMEEAFGLGRTQNEQMSFSGGTKDTRVMISGGHFDQEGVVQNTNFERFSGRVNIDQELLNDRMTVGVNVSGVFTSSNFLGFNADNLQSNVMRNIWKANPVLSPDQDAVLPGGMRPSNPLAFITQADQRSERTYLLANAFMDYKIMEGLKLKVLAGSEITHGKTYRYLSKESNLVAGSVLPGNAMLATNQSFSNLFETTLTYNKVINDVHAITAMVGYTNQESNWNSMSAGSKDFTTDAFAYNNLGAGATPLPPASYTGEFKLVSYIGRASYGYADKYLATATIRRDGSSKFGPNNKWGTFPAVALGWRIINESFMEEQSVFSNLKLRTSYGIVGSQGFPVGMAQTTYSANGWVTLDGDNLAIGTVPAVFGNDNLKWEETAQFNVGLDMGFFENRINLEVDYYKKRTTDLIMNVDLPLTTGFSRSIKNVGEIENTGLEFLLSARVIDRELTWNTDFNLTLNRNMVIDLDLPEGTNFLPGGYVKPDGPLLNTAFTIIQEGLPLNTFYGYRYLGIMKESNDTQPNANIGDPLYADINGDGIVDVDDREVLGNGYPKFMIGFNNVIAYKGLELSVFVNGAFGVEVMNLNNMIGYQFNATESSLDRYLPGINEEGTEPTRGWYNTPHGSWVNDRFIEKADFIRIKNISISYAIPTRGRLSSIRELRIFAVAENMFTLTSYSGFDPEVSALPYGSANLNIAKGLDQYSYPMQKTISIGLRLGL